MPRLVVLGAAAVGVATAVAIVASLHEVVSDTHRIALLQTCLGALALALLACACVADRWRDRAWGTRAALDERRARDATLAASADRLQQALDAGAIVGTWNWHLPTNHFTADERFARAFGLDPERCRTGLGIEEVTASIHPDDGPRVDRAIADAIARGGPYSCEYRVRQYDGVHRWIEANGRVDHASDGTPLWFPGVLLDAEKRRAAEARLRSSEQRYALAARATRNAIWDWDLATGTLEWNDGVTATFRYRENAVPSRVEWWYDAIHPDDRERVVSSIHAVIGWEPGRPGDGQSWTSEYRFRRGDGTYAAVLDHGFVARDEAGRPVRMIGAMADVTRERETLAQLEHREAHLAAVYRQTGAALAETDLDGRFLDANEQYCALVGRSLDELRRLRTHDITHPDDLAFNGPLFEKVASHGEPFSIEKRYRRPDGSHVWVAITVTRLESSTTLAQPRILGVAIEISDRKAAEARLRKSEERFRTATAAATEILWTNDPQGRMTGEQPGWAAFTGQAFEDYQGYGWSRALHPDDVAASVAAWEAAVASGSKCSMEHRVRGRDGAYRTFSVRALPVRDAAGAIVEWVGVHTDITGLRAAEEALKVADRRKDEFLATLAHELRNPLAPIRNALQILNQSANPTIGAQARAMMGRQLAQMVRLVDDLLDISRTTTGKIKLERERLDVRRIVRQALETARPHLEARGHEIVVRQPDREVRVVGDAVRLAQVLTNLLNNAAKYTEPGGTVTLQVATPESGTVRISVQDTGIGLSAESLPQVFELFAQIENGADKSQGGLGIGLALAHRLATLHGGRLTAQSEGLGHGCTFTLELPVAAALVSAEDAVPANGESLRAGRRVVVADDNRDAADSLALVLKLAGHDVSTCYDGRAALDLIRACRPDAAILDIGMPGCDGYEVARALRADATVRGVRLVAVTGWGQQDDKRRAMEAGFDHHFTKPVEPGAIENVLATPRTSAVQPA